MSQKSVKRVVKAIPGAIIGGLAGAMLITLIVIMVGVPFSKVPTHPAAVMLWGVLMCLGTSAALDFLCSKNSTVMIKLIVGTCAGAVMGFTGGILITRMFSGGAVLGAVFGLPISLGIHIVDRIPIKEKKVRFLILQFLVVVVVGCIFGLISGLIWAFAAGGARAEGYVLLAVACMSVLGSAWAGGVLAGRYVFCRNPVARRDVFWGFLLIFLCICLIGVFGFEPDRLSVDKFASPGYRADALPDSGSFDKAAVTSLVEKMRDDNVSRDTALYLLTGDVSHALRAKSLLLREVREQKFTSPAHSVKSVQFDAALRAWSYLQIRDLEGLFSQAEKKEIISWFRDVVDRVFSVEWVDWLYAVAFGRKPVGPYENQEIGVAALAVLAKAIENDYPEIADQCREYIDSHAVVWNGNFRNTDDSVNYQGWWINSCYMVAKFRPRLEQLNGNHARKAFEWLLKQWPPNGMALGYNDYRTANLADTMALGASLFHDGRYKWLATKMLRRASTGQEDLPKFCFGLASWDDSLKAITPSVGSCYLSGPGKFPHEPGPVIPDKMVLREGWSEDSLYALVNLRYSGWHKYKATNCVVTVIYGVPFVVEDSICKKHWWLPAGRTLYRDKKIDRARLNGLQLSLEGNELVMNNLLKLGSSWAQDPPQFAEVAFFETTDSVDVGMTEISDWRGWKHSRVSAMVKGDHAYLVVIDRAIGTQKGNVGLSWHLKGEPLFERNRIRLRQDKYKLDFVYPHSESWYRTEIADSFESDPAPDNARAADIDVQMLSQAVSETGFITVFLPIRDGNKPKVGHIDVEDSDGQSAYPKAMGAQLQFCSGFETLGARFEPGIYKYSTVETDAEFFHLNIRRDRRAIMTYVNASTVMLQQLPKPILLTVDGVALQKGIGWMVRDNKLIVTLPKEKGRLEIVCME